jgi:catechol 2,3-dioxygenase-like lactoylglutathione lyase family enzyme
MFLSLAHASIRVKDINESKKFYGEVLGLQHIRDYEHERFKFAFYKIGDTEIELLESKVEAYEERKVGPVDHIAFFVDDMEKEIIRLRGLDVVFTMDAVKEVMEYKVMFIQGPNGERIELMERM